MESTRHPSNQDQGQHASSSAPSWIPLSDTTKQIGAPPGHPLSSAKAPKPETALVVAGNQAIRTSKSHRRAARISMANLPPPPRPRGLALLLSRCFGIILPLRFFWPIARRLWLAAGLIVIAAAAVDYLVDLFTGSVPTITQAFFDSPVLAIPSTHPLRFMTGAGVALLITILAWGAERERQRRLNARAERVRQGLRVGMTTSQIDEQMRAALLAGNVNDNFQLATEIHEQDHTADAVWLYQLILQQAPKHFGANYNLGLIHAEMEHFDGAEGYCRTAILLNAESAEAQGLTAYVLYKLGLLEEAQRRARLAVRMGFSSQMLEALILPGLGVTSTMPATGAGKDLW